MSHLTDEQLSALLDDALPASERAAADAHLSSCDVCRTRLAEASALDASLGAVLTHDPGEAYFADFAERVAKRIEAERIAGAAPKTSFWNWFTSPRGLTLAGSTAALLVAAGLAWMRFHNEQDVARALREARPVPMLSAPAPPRERDEARPQAVPPAATAPFPAAERARDKAAGPPGSHATRVLEGSPITEDAHAPRPEGGGSALAQMKRRAVAPATGAAGSEAASSGEPAAGAAAPSAPMAQAKEEAQRVDKDRAPAPALKMAAQAPAPATHQKAALSSDTARGQSFSEWGAAKSLAKDAAPAPQLRGGRSEETKLSVSGLVTHCGNVRDSRGKAVAGAQVTAVGVPARVRTARTDASGAFCIDGLAAGDTLTVMHVGFDPWTVVITPLTSLAIDLQPVGTLGPNSTMLLGKSQPASSFTGGAHGFAAPKPDAIAPQPDVYAGLSSGVHQLVRDARDATTVAQRERTARAYEQAAKQWSAVLVQVKGAPADDARFHSVSALRTAYQLEPTSERESRLRTAITAFLALTPATMPERATVERWEMELNGAPGR